MTNYIKGIYNYVRPEGEKVSSPPPVTSTAENGHQSPSSPAEHKPEQQPGYLKWAVSGVASGIYTVGSGTVGASVNSVKWVAGTTYNVGTGVIGTAGTVVGSVVGTVGAGASAVASKVATKKKEHSD